MLVPFPRVYPLILIHFPALGKGLAMGDVARGKAAMLYWIGPLKRLPNNRRLRLQPQVEKPARQMRDGFFAFPMA